MTGFAISALADRRREIQRETAYLELEIKRCEDAIGHMDATIHWLDPYSDRTKRKPKKFAANHPMAAPEITMAMLACKGGPETGGRQGLIQAEGFSGISH